MDKRLISKERLEAIVAAYGADPVRWPEAERAAARALLDTSGDPLSGVLEAQALDALLSKAAPAKPPLMMQANLLEGAAQTLAPKGSTPRTMQPAADPGARTGWLEQAAALVFGRAGFRPFATSGLMAGVLVLGIWCGALLTSEPLGDEDLFAAYGEDYGLWTEPDSTDPFNTTGDAL